jgi:receptor protein-tyrosine kinase
VEKLSVMSAGSPTVMATELLASDRMTRLVNELATRYPDRVIIFDSPPLLATSEPSVLAHRAGQIVFVVEAERTSEIAVRSALDLIDDCENVFCVLNKTSSLFSQQRFGTYYSKYYKKRK